MTCVSLFFDYKTIHSVFAGVPVGVPVGVPFGCACVLRPPLVACGVPKVARALAAVRGRVVEETITVRPQVSMHDESCHET